MAVYNPQTFCPLPFSGYSSRNKWICCIERGDLESFNQANGDPQVLQLRQDLLEGRRPDVCHQCWEHEDRGVTSTRQNMLKGLTDEEIGSLIEQPKLRYLWIDSGNVCNLACRMCSPDWSSSLFKEHKQRYGLEKFQVSRTDMDYLLNEDYSQIRDIKIFGGEPFLNLDHVAVLERIVEQGHSRSCTLNYWTNGVVSMPQSIRDILPYFQHSLITYSVDAIGDRFHYIRTGGRWQEFEQNVQDLTDFRAEIPNDRLNYSFFVTITAMNILYLDELWSWTEDRELGPHPTSLGFCFHPPQYSLSIFLPEERDYIIKHLSASKFDRQSIIDHMLQCSFDPAARKRFWQDLEFTQSYRDLDARHYLPELLDLMKSNER